MSPLSKSLWTLCVLTSPLLAGAAFGREKPDRGVFLAEISVAQGSAVRPYEVPDATTTRSGALARYAYAELGLGFEAPTAAAFGQIGVELEVQVRSLLRDGVSSLGKDAAVRKQEGAGIALSPGFFSRWNLGLVDFKISGAYVYDTINFHDAASNTQWAGPRFGMGVTLPAASFGPSTPARPLLALRGHWMPPAGQYSVVRRDRDVENNGQFSSVEWEADVGVTFAQGDETPAPKGILVRYRRSETNYARYLPRETRESSRTVRGAEESLALMAVFAFSPG